MLAQSCEHGTRPDGKTLVSGGIRSVCLWETETGKELRSLRDEGSFHAIAFAPDGKTFATSKRRSSDTVIQVWDFSTLKELRSWFVKSYTTDWLDFTRDGKTLIASTRNVGVQRWDIASGEELPAFADGKSKGTAAALSPDGKTLVTNAAEGLMLWGYPSGKHLRTLSGGQWFIFSVVFSRDGKQLASSSMDTTVLVWDVAR